MPGVVRHHVVIVPLILCVAASLAVTSLFTDSLTFDEPGHLAAGMNILRTGNYWLGLDHPPLARVWAAWPLLWIEQRWPAATDPAWRLADEFSVGHAWLCDLNDGERLLRVARCMIVPLFLGTCLAVYALARALFGRRAGILALVLASLSPTMLAHGRLVTTDMATTLCSALTLLGGARLLRTVTWPRLAGTGLALAAASVAKYSWLPLLPALGAMAAYAIVRRRPLGLAVWPWSPWRAAAHARPTLLYGYGARVAVVSGAGLFLAAMTWAGIWTTYGWQSRVIRPPRPGAEYEQVRAQTAHIAAKVERHWHEVFHAADGRPRPGLAPAVLAWVVDHHVLPEAYLLGLAKVYKRSLSRATYLNGRCSETPEWTYFPEAFALKTPVATLLLLAAGSAAVVAGRQHVRDPAPLWGGTVFVMLYGATAITGGLAIGERHLLPIYPMFFVVGGAATAWMASRTGRALVGLGVVWLIWANLSVYPQYVAYFNELGGGPRRGHLYLADSNIDWGQDLWRLTRYAAAHREERLKLAYFGTADPRRYGLACDPLPSSPPLGRVGDLSAGTYVISVNQLLGLHDRLVRETAWEDPGHLQTYRELHARFAYSEANRIAAHGSEAHRQWEQLRWSWLMRQLRRRPPDERIGYSFFVYRLSQADIDALTQP